MTSAAALILRLRTSRPDWVHVIDRPAWQDSPFDVYEKEGHNYSGCIFFAELSQQTLEDVIGCAMEEHIEQRQHRSIPGLVVERHFRLYDLHDSIVLNMFSSSATKTFVAENPSCVIVR
jgi:hypothetical protein